MNRTRSKWMVTVLAMVFLLCVACATPEKAVATEEIKKPLLVLMYHQLLPSKHTQYIIDPELFRQDLKRLTEAGYQSVTTQDVIDYVYSEKDLPDKPVLITFDDGHYNNLYYGSEILQDYGFTALLSVVGSFCETTTKTETGGHVTYSYLTFPEIRKMAKNGPFEFGNHTYRMHQFKPRFGIQQKPGESDEDYQKALLADVRKLQDLFAKECQVTTHVFAFPFGAYSPLAVQTLRKEGFLMMLTCNEGISILKKGDPTCLDHIKRYNRSSSLNLDRLLEKAARVTV